MLLFCMSPPPIQFSSHLTRRMLSTKITVVPVKYFVIICISFHVVLVLCFRVRRAKTCYKTQVQEVKWITTERPKQNWLSNEHSEKLREPTSIMKYISADQNI